MAFNQNDREEARGQVLLHPVNQNRNVRQYQPVNQDRVNNLFDPFGFSETDDDMGPDNVSNAANKDPYSDQGFRSQHYNDVESKKKLYWLRQNNYFWNLHMQVAYRRL